MLHSVDKTVQELGKQGATWEVSNHGAPLAALVVLILTFLSGKLGASEAFDATSILWRQVRRFARKLRRKSKVKLTMLVQTFHLFIAPRQITPDGLTTYN